MYVYVYVCMCVWLWVAVCVCVRVCVCACVCGLYSLPESAKLIFPAKWFCHSRQIQEMFKLAGMGAASKFLTIRGWTIGPVGGIIFGEVRVILFFWPVGHG